MFKSAIVSVVIAFAIFKLYARYVSIVINDPDQEYDFIIVGAGTTGSVLANRLTENTTFKVLLIEAGPEDNFDPIARVPLLTPFNKGRWIDWNFKSENMKPYSDATNNNAFHISRGKTLGGTSAINFQLYSRGAPSDYDSWAKKGADGWNYEQILPFFRKSETVEHAYPIDDSLHGTSGPLKVNLLEKLGLTDIFMEAAEELGLERLDDHNSPDVMGTALHQTTVHKGLRQSAAKAFLYPVAHSRRDQLHIVAEAYVTKVLIEKRNDGQNTAVGVEFSKNGQKKTVSAKREVILSAGAYGTPHILLLSGIGPREQLQKHGVKLVQHLPGVGLNYQDHIFLPLYFHANNIAFGDTASVKEILYSVPKWMFDGSGPLASTGTALANFNVHKSKDESKKEPNMPEMQALLILAEADTNAHDFVTSGFDYKPGIFDYERAKTERGGVMYSFIIFAVLLHPKSSGTVKLRSSNPLDKPTIDPNMYSHPDDIDTMVEGIKWIIGTEDTKAFKSKQAKFVNIIKTCDDTLRNDEFYECLIRSESHLFHPCCTAMMGEHDEQNAVVDPQLRVYGVQNLRVADASIMPHITSGPLQATCYMIGEKAASMILEDFS